MGQRWYVVSTKYNLELEAARNLINQNIEAFCPIYQHQIKKRNKIVQLSLPLFARYIFARFDIEYDQWKKINNTKGVYKILASSEDRATPVEVGYVESLIEASRETGGLRKKEIKTNKNIQIGMQVRANILNYNGIVGTVVRVYKNKIVIKSALLFKSVEVYLPLDSVEPIVDLAQR